MSDEEKVIEKIAMIAQGCFQQHPVVILGSGASVVHGLRGMGDLAQYLMDNVDAVDGEETDAWLLIKTAVNGGVKTSQVAAQKSATVDMACLSAV